MPTLRSIALFIVAGLCEIGGGYLIWQWWRNHAPWYAGIAGAALLIAYGIVPTYQPANFGRVYAAYGGSLRRTLDSVGLEDRSYPPGRVRPDRRGRLPNRRCDHHVLAALTSRQKIEFAGV